MRITSVAKASRLWSDTTIDKVTKMAKRHEADGAHRADLDDLLNGRHLRHTGTLKRGRMVMKTLVGVVALILAMPTPASATSGTLTISSDTTLTENHYGNIVIDADNVALDCDGFRVIGPGSDPPSDDGILVAYHSGVTIRNCTVQDFARGIVLDASTATTVVGNRLVGNGEYGIFLHDADGTGVLRNVATGNPGSAYGGSDFDWGVFAYNSATANGGHGFDVTRSSHNTFRGNLATGNTGHGFKIFDDTDYNVFERNRVDGNGMTGFLMYGGYDQNQQYQLQPPDHNTFSNNEAIGNGEGGLYLLTDSTANLVTANLILRNGESGIALVDAHDNIVTRNIACANADWDAFQQDGSGNAWSANVFCSYSL